MTILNGPRSWIPIIVIIGIVVGCNPTSPMRTTSVTVSPEPEPSATELISSPTASPIPKPVKVINPGFEAQDSGGKPAGWNTTGTESAVLTEEKGHSGNFRLTHKSAETYSVETWQTITGLADDWYTLRAWVRSSGGQNDVHLALKCGGEEKWVSCPCNHTGVSLDPPLSFQSGH